MVQNPLPGLFAKPQPSRGRAQDGLLLGVTQVEGLDEECKVLSVRNLRGIILAREVTSPHAAVRAIGVDYCPDERVGVNEGVGLVRACHQPGEFGEQVGVSGQMQRFLDCLTLNPIVSSGEHAMVEDYGEIGVSPEHGLQLVGERQTDEDIDDDAEAFSRRP